MVDSRIETIAHWDPAGRLQAYSYAIIMSVGIVVEIQWSWS